MIYDHRTYVCRPGLLKAHIALYQEHGFKVQSKFFGFQEHHDVVNVRLNAD